MSEQADARGREGEDRDRPEEQTTGRDTTVGDTTEDAATGEAAAGEAAGEGASQRGEPEGPAGQRRDPGHQLARMTDAPPPPQRPPRRTGVFLDPEDLREHIGGLLRVVLGGYEVDAYGNFTFTHEDARVFVTVGPGPIGPTVGVFSVTNLRVELTPDLARFLLTTNHRLGFGSFSYDPDNQAVWLRHTLLGTTLDGPELHSAVAAVASTAAHFDDEIQQRFGGRTFHDSPDEVKAARPPEATEQQPPPSAGGYL